MALRRDQTEATAVRSHEMRRRAFLATITGGLLAAPLAVGAQSAGKVHRIGFLGNSTEALEANLVGPFREGLRERGYVEGRDLIIEYRWAEGAYERFPARSSRSSLPSSRMSSSRRARPRPSRSSA